MTDRLAAALLAGMALASPVHAQTGPGIAQMKAGLASPSADTRAASIEGLAGIGGFDAADAIAGALGDPDDGVQRAAIDALLTMYTVPGDLRGRQWGVGAGTPPVTRVEQAFEAGPFATMPARVPESAITGLASLVRADESLRTRVSAAYLLGVIAAPAMGTPPPGLERAGAELAAALSHPDAATRQVVARVIGRIFTPGEGRTVPIGLGDAVIHAMNDPDPDVRRWAMDSLGWMRYTRALAALTERFAFHGHGPDASAALHALARIASPASAPVFLDQLRSQTPALRMIAAEGLGRLGGAEAKAAIRDLAARERHPSVRLAVAFAQVRHGDLQDVGPIADGLRATETEVQARVYLAEIGMDNPAALHPLLQSRDTRLRQGTVELLGVSGRPDQIPVVEPMLGDPQPAVIEAASEALRRLRAYEALAAR